MEKINLPSADRVAEIAHSVEASRGASGLTPAQIERNDLMEVVRYLCSEKSLTGWYRRYIRERLDDKINWAP